MNIHSNYVKINGIRLHYVNVGQGKIIIFVHGFHEFGGGRRENHLIKPTLLKDSMDPPPPGYLDS
jgi:hypothetical protein